MIDSRAGTITVNIGQRDHVIKQSPSVLNSDRKGGTTGAAVWQVTPLIADWLSSKDNALFKHGVLSERSTVLELGSGVSGILPLTLGPRVSRFMATDQQYILKLLKENIDTNRDSQTRRPSGRGPSQSSHQASHLVDVLALDWELDDVQSFLTVNGAADGVDALMMCDCIYNYALIQPLVQTCTDV